MAETIPRGDRLARPVPYRYNAFFPYRFVSSFFDLVFGDKFFNPSLIAAFESFLVALWYCLVFSSCAAHLTSSVAPNVRIEVFKSFYIVQSDADTHEVYKSIQAELLRRNRNASFGPRSKTPADVDVVVTYQDYWHWDMGWYLVDLLIQLRDPKTNVLLASALSYRSSLQRKDPESTAREILDSILK